MHPRNPFCALHVVALASAAALFAAEPKSVWTTCPSGTTANLWGAVARGATSNGTGALLVAVGEQGTILTSIDDGATWSAQSSGTSSTLTAVCYSNDLKRFFVVGDGGVILSSADAATWSRETSPTTVRLNAVGARSYGDHDTIYAVGEVGAGLLQREQNGTWTQTDAGFGARSMRGLSFAWGDFVVGAGGGLFMPTSIDGMYSLANPWTAVEIPTGANLTAMATEFELRGDFIGRGTGYVAVGATGTIVRRVGSDPWTASASGTSDDLRAICRRDGLGLRLFTNDVLIAIGEFFAVGTHGVTLRSSDGVAWQPDVSPTTQNLNAVIPAGNYVLALGDAGTIVRTGGTSTLPVITRQPSIGVDADGNGYLEADATGEGALTYYWVIYTGGGQPFGFGTGHPRQLLSGNRSIPTIAPWPMYRLYVVNAFGAASSGIIVPNRFVNLSTRAVVGAGEDALIGGFTIYSVSASATRSVLIRAVGPGLRQFGVAGALTAPRLSVYAGTQLVATNSDWRQNANAAAVVSANSRAGAFALRDDSADAALLVQLRQGNYTAKVDTADGQPGVALLEVYDADPPNFAHVGNLSARARVEDATGVLIGGLVIDGPLKKSLLVRAAGPALSALGVQDALARPAITVWQGNRMIAKGGAWGDSPDVETIRGFAQQRGAFPFAEGSADAAMLIELDPGTYTLQVTGADGDRGVALLEIYER